MLLFKAFETSAGRITVGLMLIFLGIMFFAMGLDGEGAGVFVFAIILVGIGASVLFSDYAIRKDSKETIEKEYNKNTKRNGQFNQTGSIGRLIYDSKNKMFKFSNDTKIFSFSELESFKVYEDSQSIANGSRGIAVTFAGVLIGGTTKVNTREQVENLSIVIKVNGINAGRYTYNYIDQERPLYKNSEAFRLAIEEVEDICSFFDNRVLN